MNDLAGNQVFRGEWLEDIPLDWGQRRIKHLFSIKKEIAGELGHDVISITQRGAKLKDTESGEGQLSMDYSKYQLVTRGDFLMNHMDLLTGYVDISGFDGVTSPDYRVFVSSSADVHPSYFLYVFQHCYKSKIFYGYGRGSSHLGRWRFPTVEFEDFYLPVPTPKEQKLIARYLDKKTNKIDSLIEKTQRKIELLKEQRTSLINHYVTKGLDPNIEMKNSGVEWVGDIPKHWKTSRFKYHFNFGMGETILKEQLTEVGYPVLSATEKYKVLGFYDSPSLLLKEGDIVIPARGNSIGFVKIVRETSVSTQTTIYGKRQTQIDTKFFSYFCEGNKPFLFQFEQTAIPQITVEQVQNNLILLPPVHEQEKIRRKLDQICSLSEALINKLASRKDLFIEYRQSLISSVVTGKVRVMEDMI